MPQWQQVHWHCEENDLYYDVVIVIIVRPFSLPLLLILLRLRQVHSSSFTFAMDAMSFVIVSQNRD